MTREIDGIAKRSSVSDLFIFLCPFLTHLPKATYSNLENHPRMIQARDGKPVPKIKLDSRTGLPTVGDRTKTRAPASEVISGSEEEDSGYLRESSCLQDING